MDYISTRDKHATAETFTDILLGGLSPDGGLYMPAVYPQLTGETLNAWRQVLIDGGLSLIHI